MSRKLIKKDNKFLARIVTENPKPCAFCHRKVDDEINYGKLYAIGDIQCHYFCALLSCCLVQKGSDNTGLFGFQYKDILAELERCKKHKCSYCGQSGANLGCCVTICRKQFHLPCGREKHAVSLFYGTFKSFCQLHAPKQKLPDHIMANAKRRKQGTKALKAGNCAINEKELETSESMVCVICYEVVDGFPTLETFWPPCCARDAWFHRTCVQRMALSAGMHYLKCPLCNDKEVFYDSVISQGYYVPDRDAAWELEQNAFSEIYERSITCGADDCQCPMGRNHDADNGPWDIKLCLLCGSIGRHQQCITSSSCKTESSDTFVCATCEPVAPADLNTLANNIEAVIQEEQAQAASTNRRRPIMPCRMSLRRTKGRNAILNRPSGSRMVSRTDQASGPSGIRSMTRNELYAIMQRSNEATFEGKLHFMEREILNQYADNQHVLAEVKQKLSVIKYQFKQKWLAANKTKLRFEENNADWLKNTICLPCAESTNVTSSRLDLNLKRPRKAPTPRKQADSISLSPSKLKTCHNSLIKDPFSPSKELSRLKDSFSPTKEQNRLSKIPFSPSKYGNGLLKDQFSPSKFGNGLSKDQFSPSKSGNGLSKDQFSPSKFGNGLLKDQFSPSKFRNGLSKDKFSPSKIIEGLEERLLTGLNDDIVEKLRRKIMKPRPMCVKKKIVNETLQNLLNTSPKQKDPLRDWFSPKKHEFDNNKNIENGSPNKEDISTPKKTSTPDKENPIKIESADEDDSNSTFQLPPEFIADCQSDDSLNFDTPKCKTVEIKQDSSLEIFEKDPDHTVGIDVITIENSPIYPKSPPKTSKSPKTDKVFKFSPLGKELVDVEDFKKEYLNEVGFNKVSKSPLKIRTEIDFAMNLANQCENDVKPSKNDKKALKRRKSDVPNERVGGKKRKLSESDLVLHYRLSPVKYNENEKQTKNKSKKRKKNKRSDSKKLRVTFDSDSKNKKSKLKTKLSVDNKNIKLKIKWKKEQLHLKLESKSEKTKKIKQKSRLNLKQYVLHYPTEGKSTDVLVKPEVDVSPLKRKYIKQEKSPDNFKQTLLHSFFKVKSPNEK